MMLDSTRYVGLLAQVEPEDGPQVEAMLCICIGPSFNLEAGGLAHTQSQHRGGGNT